MERVRVLLADDHAVLRDGLAALIDAQSDMVVVAHAGSGAEAVQQAQEVQPAVAVMDLSMPGMSGVRAIEELSRAQPSIQIVVLSRHNEPGYLRQAMAGGARAYVLKQSLATEVLKAIRSVTSGQTYLDPTLSSRLAQQAVGQAEPRNGAPADLSEREQTVVRMIAQGYSGKEVAAKLQLSVKTVDTYKARAMEKLGLYSRAALVRYALDQSWLDHEH